MTAEEKNLEMLQDLSNALNNAKIQNVVNVDPVTRKEITEKKSLMELKVEIKFHLNQMAGHAVEIGKLLIEAKAQVEHGEWQKWLEENFNLSYRSAKNFMDIAERFPNVKSIADLNSTQMIAMLSLPAGEEEKFIEEKAEEGRPVDEMTTRELREEIKRWKRKYEGEKIGRDLDIERLEFLDEENQKLQHTKEQAEKDQSKLISEHFDTLEEKRELEEKIESLQNQLIDAKAKQVEVAPPDYEPLKKELAEVKATNEQLQNELKELHENPIEVSAVEYPADYDAMKAELEALKKQNADLQSEYESEQKIKNLFLTAQDIANYVPIPAVLKKMTEKNYVYRSEMKMLVGMLDVIKNNIEKFLEEKQAK